MGSYLWSMNEPEKGEVWITNEPLYLRCGYEYPAVLDLEGDIEVPKGTFVLIVVPRAQLLLHSAAETWQHRCLIMGRAAWLEWRDIETGWVTKMRD